MATPPTTTVTTCLTMVFQGSETCRCASSDFSRAGPSPGPESSGGPGPGFSLIWIFRRRRPSPVPLGQGHGASDIAGRAHRGVDEAADEWHEEEHKDPPRLRPSAVVGTPEVVEDAPGNDDGNQEEPEEHSDGQEGVQEREIVGEHCPSPFAGSAR